MRLYLTSYRLGDHPEDLCALAGDQTHVAVVANAGDGFDPAGRQPHVEREIADLERLGMTAEELDLRTWFGRRDELAAHLKRFGVVWATGGNCFVLRRAMRLSGLDELLIDDLERDELVYAGYSAGAIMACPSLRGIELMDEPGAQPEGYPGEIVWDGLGRVPFLIVPHYRSDHGETELAEECIAACVAEHVPFVALRDGETVVVDGKSTRVTPRSR